jgi:arylsulfatase A-like enzyme/Tfp pilus assembly protein PilF
MNKNRSSNVVFFFFLFLAFFIILVPLEASNTKKNSGKNVLLITIDTLRSDRLSCYDSQYVHTPNIDSLAEKGILFSRAFANTSTTLPSHTNILLGVSPLYHGVHDNLHFVVREDFLTLAEHLKANGYATAAFVGAYPLDSRFGLAQGFDIYDDEYMHRYDQNLSTLERRAEDVIDTAIESMEKISSPWFVWIHCYDPHLPYEPPEPFKSQFAENPYEGEVAYVDFMMGKLLKFLEEKRLMDETMIVFTGDHGESLGQHGEMSHGFYAYNSAIWVPLIINVPGLEAKRMQLNVSHLDIFPTVCDFAGVKKPSFLQGSSLLPVLRGKKLADRPIFFESMYPYYSHGWAPLRGFIAGHEKFIDSPIPEVYDLEKDFDEATNLASARKLDGYRNQLGVIIKDLSSPESLHSRESYDRETLKKLSSLGYISRSPGAAKESFGQEDDVKTLLPFHNKVFEAMNMYGKGKTNEAIEMLKNIITARKDIGIAYYRLGFLFMNEGKTDEALEILRQGLSNVPDDYDVYRNYVNILRRAQKFDEIIENFHEKSYREISVDPEIWNNLGFAYGQIEKWDEAINAYNRAVSLDSKYAEAFHNLGDAYRLLAIKNKDRGLLKKSSEKFQKAIDADPNYPSPYFGLGRVHQILRNLDEAIYHFKKALELQPDFGAAYYYLGLTYLDKGEKSQALACFVTIKEKFSSTYSEEQKRRIDELIKQCKDKI